MITPVYISDIIGSVVAAASAGKYNGTDKTLLQTIKDNETAALGKPSKIEQINFQHGHKIELIETLYQMDKSPTERFNKYPLVWLVQDLTEEIGKETGVYAEVSLSIIIAHHTEHSHKIGTRMEKVFKPVLYPIYYQLLEYLSRSARVIEGNDEMIRHRKIDRSYWGRNAVGGNDKLKLEDYVDAIELENISLKINFSNC
jgi:hypothetical protein